MEKQLCKLNCSYGKVSHALNSNLRPYIFIVNYSSCRSRIHYVKVYKISSRLDKKLRRRNFHYSSAKKECREFETTHLNYQKNEGCTELCFYCVSKDFLKNPKF